MRPHTEGRREDTLRAFCLAGSVSGGGERGDNCNTRVFLRRRGEGEGYMKRIAGGFVENCHVMM